MSQSLKITTQTLRNSIKSLSPTATYIWSTKSIEIVEIIEKTQDGFVMSRDDIHRVGNALKFIERLHGKLLTEYSECIEYLKTNQDWVKHDFVEKWEDYSNHCNSSYNERKSIRNRFLQEMYICREENLIHELEHSPWGEQILRKLRILRKRRELCLPQTETDCV